MIVLFHILDDSIGLAGALIFAELALLVHAKSGVSLDVKLAAKVLVLGAVKGGNRNVILLQSLGGLGILGSKVLAMTAPIGVELNEHGGVTLDELFKVGGGELDDAGVVEGLFNVDLVFSQDGGGVKGGEGKDGGEGDDAHSNAV
jgi:hypothetical protein